MPPMDLDFSCPGQLWTGPNFLKFLRVLSFKVWDPYFGSSPSETYKSGGNTNKGAHLFWYFCNLQLTKISVEKDINTSAKIILLCLGLQNCNWSFIKIRFLASFFNLS